MKRLSIISLITTACLMLSACSGFGINVQDSLSPPKPSGELYEIQKTLEASVGGDAELVYPSLGKYRSAIITKDIDSDGKYEVFSFYRTETDDKATVMHINYIRWVDEKWTSVSDLQLDCSGVQSIEFVKLDNSPIPKILVNWERFSATDKQLSVYSIDRGTLFEITKSDYSVYTTFDFNDDGIFEVVALHLDKENRTSTAKLLGLGETGFSEISSCKLDPLATSYFPPVISTFTDGTPAIFIDAAKSTGMITEILYVKDGNQLVSALPYTVNFENVNSLRASSIRSLDYDKDGCVDIPLNQKLPMVQSSAEEDSAYMTVWNRFDGEKFTPIKHTIINYTDGYYIEVPLEWINNIAIQRRVETYQRVFYRWDSILNEVGEEVIRIQSVPIKTWEIDSAVYEGYKEYARNSENVFIVKFGNSALTPSEDYVRQHFKLIGTDVIQPVQ